MYENILLPTDGSKGAQPAVDQAIANAALAGATLHVLNVVEPLYTGETGYERVLEAMEAEGERLVAAVGEQADEHGISTVTEIKFGVPHRQILDYAEANDIDLIVMGTHGRTGLGRYLLGSVTEKVVRLSETPVLTVRMEETD